MNIQLEGNSDCRLDEFKKLETDSRKLKYHSKCLNNEWVAYEQNEGWDIVYFHVNKRNRNIQECGQSESDRTGSFSMYQNSEKLTEDIRFRLSGLVGESWNGTTFYKGEPKYAQQIQKINGYIYKIDKESKKLKPHFKRLSKNKLKGLSAKYIKDLIANRKGEKTGLKVSIDKVIEYLPDEFIF